METSELASYGQEGGVDVGMWHVGGCRAGNQKFHTRPVGGAVIMAMVPFSPLQ